MIPSQQAQIPVRVTDVRAASSSVKTFTLERTDGAPLPRFSGGSHVVVTLRSNERTFRNAYSLMSPPDNDAFYEISVRRDDTGRGGSRFMHERVCKGSELEISAPVNLFGLNTIARRQVFIAGGIGITPVLAQMHEVRQRGEPYELHYQFRGADCAPFRDRITTEHGNHVTLHDSARGEYVDPEAVLREQPLGTHVYVCGPAGLITAVQDASTRLGWPRRHVHAEAFATPPPGQPFTIMLSRSGREIEVPADVSALEALEEAGLEPPCSCRGGACGQCETAVLEGEIEHHDHFLPEDVKAANTRMMICVSRAHSKRIVLDL